MDNTMGYQEYKDGISSRLNSAAEDFFTVGYYLRKISENALFLEDNYENIWDFAKKEFNLSKSSASRFMAINARFSLDGGEHMEQKYIGMGVSKLQEMLGLPDEELERVTKETTVKEIRAIKAAMKPDQEPLSYYGETKTVYPEGSLLSTPGCGHKHDCFSCSRECGIRQEPRQCITTPIGNPKPCSLIGNEDFKRDIAYSLHREKCQIVHPELALVRDGDKEPDPCCLNCEHKEYCYSCCDVATKSVEQAKKDKERERQRKARELEKERAEKAAQKAEEQEPTESEIKQLYEKLHISRFSADAMENLTDELRSRYGKTYQGGTCGDGWYDSTPHGVRINQKKLTWVQIAKEFRKLWDQEHAQPEVPEPELPAIIDGEYTEINDAPEQEPEAEQEAGTGTLSEPETIKTDEADQESTEPEESQHEARTESKRDPESYDGDDVSILLAKHQNDLEMYIEAELPEGMIRTERIFVDALTLLEKRMEEDGGEVEQDEEPNQNRYQR